MIIIEDCGNVKFVAGSIIHKAMLTKKSDVNDCKIKESKKFTQSEKIHWIILIDNWQMQLWTNIF